MRYGIKELFDLYEYVGRNCKDDANLRDKQDRKLWIEAAAVTDSIYLLKHKNKILGFTIAWPVEKIDFESVSLPRYDEDGKVLFCFYCHAVERLRTKKLGLVPELSGPMAYLLVEILQKFPDLRMISYYKIKDGSRKVHVLPIPQPAQVAEVA